VAQKWVIFGHPRNRLDQISSNRIEWNRFSKGSPAWSLEGERLALDAPWNDNPTWKDEPEKAISGMEKNRSKTGGGRKLRKNKNNVSVWGTGPCDTENSHEHRGAETNRHRTDIAQRYMRGETEKLPAHEYVGANQSKGTKHTKRSGVKDEGSPVPWRKPLALVLGLGLDHSDLGGLASDGSA